MGPEPLKPGFESGAHAPFQPLPLLLPGSLLPSRSPPWLPSAGCTHPLPLPWLPSTMAQVSAARPLLREVLPDRPVLCHPPSPRTVSQHPSLHHHRMHAPQKQDLHQRFAPFSPRPHIWYMLSTAVKSKGTLPPACVEWSSEPPQENPDTPTSEPGGREMSRALSCIQELSEGGPSAKNSGGTGNTSLTF